MRLFGRKIIYTATPTITAQNVKDELHKAIQIHREYEVDLNYFVAGDSFDEEEIFKQVITSASKEKSTKFMIRLLEYFISLLKSSLKE